MRSDSSERLPPGAVYELLGEANLASAATLARASALAEEHHDRAGRRRLIGVAMNLGSWMLKLESPESRRHPFFDDVLFGIRTRADTGNADLLVLTGLSGQVSGEPTHYLDLCRRHGADGIILGAFLPEEPELAVLMVSGFPCVAIDTQLIGQRAGFVTSDNVGGAFAAVRHLAEQGRRRIAYVGGWGPEPAHIDRRLGYESALGGLGLESREEYVLLGGWLHERAHDLTGQMLELAEPPDAIFCASDVMAIGAMRAIEQAGLRVPEDIAVVGFDDTEYAQIAVPSLTSVRQDRVGLGAAAVEALLRMLDAPESPPPSILLPVELIVRESSTARTPHSSRDAHGRPGKRAEPIETPDRPTIVGPVSRLSVAALYRLLGHISGAPPIPPIGTSDDIEQQEWSPEKRRLVALAIDTGPDQSFRHAFFDELFYEIRACAYTHAIDLFVFTNVGTTPGTPFPPFLELCERYRTDGLVVVSLPLEEPPIASLAASGFPCVTLDVDLLSDRIGFVMSDNIGGAVKVTKHLIETGRRRIAFIG
ncbi:MAG: substrate-binding domain-containing protein, partial [Gaiellaceae bacterium]